MSTLNLEKIFSPRRIAVIGASGDPDSAGHWVLKNLIASGFEGTVYPVNKNRESVQGISSYAAVADILKPVDLAIIATPASTVPELITECGEAGIRGVIVISAGFREIGEEGRKLEREILRNARPYGLRILGPNCLGILVPSLKMNASFASAMPLAGRVAFISQSGALCTSILDWASQEKFGFSYFVSIGGMIDVDFGDLIDYFGSDPQTSSIILYLESLTNARKFMSAARAFARTKPIIAIKSGRFAEGMKAAASHTGAMVGEDIVYDAAFQRAGVVRVEEIADLFNAAEILAKQRNPPGPRLAILTNAGGPGVIATDTLIKYGGQLARFSERTLDKLNQMLPPFWSRSNPADILGDAPPERFGRALEVLLEDEGVDGVMVILTPQANTNPAAVARLVAESAKDSAKSVLACWMGAESVRAGVEILNRYGFATYRTPEQAVKTFTYMYSYAHNLELLHETPKDILAEFLVDRKKSKDLIRAGNGEFLDEIRAMKLLEAYGLPAIHPRLARDGEEAVLIARQVGYPVVLKVRSPQVIHKTDVGGVQLNLSSDEAVKRGVEKILLEVRRSLPEARVEGVTVQKMIEKPGLEVILGSKKDPTFGAVILFGMGGVAAEIFQDRAVALPPLNERLAQRLVESIRGYKLLQGFRGHPPVNLDLLKEILIRFSYLIVDHPEILEMDINPLRIGQEGAWALDARVRLDREAMTRDLPPYDHLAIRPYPEEYVRQEKMKDGTPLLLRPIRPEDVHLWQELVSGFSPETMRLRFFIAGQKITREMAVRFCFIDYEREIAIVAQIDQKGAQPFVGVGRVATLPDRVTANFAVAVGDRWQGQGVGSLLMDECLRIARERGIHRMTGETLPENRTVIGMLQRRGFKLAAREGIVEASLSWNEPPPAGHS